jgi:hypothetical protein
MMASGGGKEPTGVNLTSSAITQLNLNDVLMGRGAPAIDNEGNVRFRRIVQSRRAEYFSVSRRQAKDQIARQIVSTVISAGGRFLKKVDSPALATDPVLTGEVQAWVMVEDDAVLSKVKQALRDRSSEDEEPRPRRRKRVKSGNLVPEDDSESSRLVAQKTEARSQGIGDLLRQGHLGLGQVITSTAAASDLEHQLPSQRLPSLQSAVPGAFSREPMDDRISALLRLSVPYQVPQQAQASASAFQHQGGSLLQSDNDVARALRNFPRESPREVLLGGLASRLAQARHPSHADILALASMPRLSMDSFLGSISDGRNAPNLRDQRFSPTGEASLEAILGASLSLTGQGSAVPPTERKSGEELIFDAFLNPKLPSHSNLLTNFLPVSLFEASLLFALCDFGLPLPTETGVAAASQQPSRWSWEALAQQVVQQSAGTQNGKTRSFLFLATLRGADAESIGRSTVLASAFVNHPDELGRSTVMLLEKLRQLGASTQGSERLSSSQPSTSSTSSSLAVGGRDSHSRVGPHLATALEKWAVRLEVATEGGAPVAFSATDANDPTLNDKSLSGIACYDARDCHKIFSLVGIMTRLRHIFFRHEEATVLSALHSFPDRFTPLGGAMWWSDGDVAGRDLWLLQTALEKGVASVIGADAPNITILQAPFRTLQQALVSTRAVEVRLEQLVIFLHSHFELGNRQRILEGRVTAFQILLR